jgi:ABC-type maltose transport system permease subunit
MWIWGVENLISLYSYRTFKNYLILGLFTSSFTILFCLFCAFALTRFHNNAVVIPKNRPFKNFLVFVRRNAQNNEYEWHYNLFIGHARFQLLVLVLCTIADYILSYYEF